MKRIKDELGAVPANTLIWVLAVIGIVLLVLALVGGLDFGK